jgi:hypothetical protein
MKSIIYLTGVNYQNPQRWGTDMDKNLIEFIKGAGYIVVVVLTIWFGINVITNSVGF